MKLHEIANIMSKANKTNLTGGDMPNAYTDNAESQSKLPRTKKKDMYGTNGIATSVNTGGDSGGDGGSTGGSTGGSAGGGAGGAGGGGGA
jgi:hypothetical protein